MFGVVRVCARAVRAAPVASLKLRPAISSPSFTIARRSLCAGGDMEVPIPELGAESIVEGGILSIAKSVGDYVAAEEMVAEIETGATFWRLAAIGKNDRAATAPLACHRPSHTCVVHMCAINVPQIR